MSEELKVIPFYGLGGLQNNQESIHVAIEQNFQQICDAINELNGNSDKEDDDIVKVGRPKKEDSE
jgi:hypothetical protein